MTQFRINQGKIEVYSERQHNDAIRYIWGDVEEQESEDGEVVSYIKIGHTIAQWIEGAGCGWIETPHWTQLNNSIALPV